MKTKFFLAGDENEAVLLRSDRVLEENSWSSKTDRKIFSARKYGHIHMYGKLFEVRYIDHIDSSLSLGEICDEWNLSEERYEMISLDDWCWELTKRPL